MFDYIKGECGHVIFYIQCVTYAFWLMSYECIGNEVKQMRFQDEIECINKRRSSRIIALEEKKQQQREKELELASERKNNSINHDIKNTEKGKGKDKGKATMEVWNNLSNINEDDEGSTKKKKDKKKKDKSKSKELYQLISSIKEIERQSTSRTNDSSLNGMPLKNILEIIIDFLQRMDQDELFAEPVNPDVAKNYYEIVKQPMDFATMRAKLHENMYTNFDLFKRDILLICSNAKNVNPRTSIYHEVAEDISRHAKCIFEALSVVPQHVDLESSLNKKRSGRKPKNAQQKTSRRDSPKHGGRQNVAYLKEVEKRDMYKPATKLLVSEVLCANKPNIQLNENQFKYKESLLQFVKDLGPIAQRVAAKKLEPLQHQQLCIGNTSTQNRLENASGSQIIHQPTPHIPTQPDTLNAPTFPLALPYHNTSLTIPGSATQKNNIINKTRNFRSISKGNMDSPIENVSSSVGPIQEETNRIHLGVNKTSNTREWNISTGISYMLANGSSTSTNNVFAPHPPTSIISGLQPRLSRNINSLSGLPLMPRLENTMPFMRSNTTEPSLVNQPRPRASIYDMPRHNLEELSLVHQPWKTNAMFSMIPSRVTPWSQPMQEGPIPGTPYQRMSFQALLNSPDFNNSSYTMPANLGQNIMHQAAPYTPQATQGFPNVQMQLRQESIPLQQPTSLSSSSLQEVSPQLLRDNNDKQLNLDLHL